MDYTQFYCYECKFCMFDVFGRVICLSKDTTTGYNLTGMELFNPKVMYLENPTVNIFEDKEAHVPSTFIALKREMGINGLFLASVYSPKYTNAAEHPIDHLHSVLCDFDFNIVFDPQPEYAKVVNYPYSKLIGYNGIRSIDIIKKID